jgi:small-conductance mechanosensitive channel
MPYWQRFAILGGVLLVTAVVARLIDRRIARRGGLRAETATRYRVLRRSIVSAIAVIGVLSALLVIPEVRTVAGGILASSAVIGLIIGFASQRTIGNFVAGLMIAFTQPLRLGDRVEIAGVEGTVEEIALTYTFIRTPDNGRLVIPNEKLASDTIRNWTIRGRDKLAEVTVQIPIESDLRVAVEALREEVAAERQGEVVVSALADKATITLCAWAPDASAAERLESDLRLRAHERLRAAGVFG